MRFKRNFMEVQYLLAVYNRPKLEKVMNYMDGYARENFGKELTITCVFRDTRDTDVHAWGRGLDVRIWNLTEEERIELRDAVNQAFPYNDKGTRFTCIYGDNDPAGNHNDHFHIQISSGS